MESIVFRGRTFLVVFAFHSGFKFANAFAQAFHKLWNFASTEQK